MQNIAKDWAEGNWVMLFVSWADGRKIISIFLVHSRWDLGIKRTEIYDLVYMKIKGAGWKENCGIQNSRIEGSKGNIVIDPKQKL